MELSDFSDINIEQWQLGHWYFVPRKPGCFGSGLPHIRGYDIYRKDPNNPTRALFVPIGSNFTLPRAKQICEDYNQSVGPQGEISPGF